MKARRLEAHNEDSRLWHLLTWYSALQSAADAEFKVLLVAPLLTSSAW
jgi:hypothetical protein